MEEKTTLDEAVTALNDNVDLFIGAASGFFFIGTKKDYQEMIDGISDKYFMQFENSANKCKLRLKSSRQQMSNLKMIEGETDSEFADRIFQSLKNYQLEISALDNAITRVKTFVPLRNRIVTELYKKKYEDGTAIIVEGYEDGKFWLKEEWERNNEPIDESNHTTL